ncbi:hypothetical protein Tco_0971320 [Tanacetum coccineum]
MASLKFVDQHNMVACLEKSEENTEFHQIVDFLSTCSINYALTVSPTIYASYIEQFWNTATSKIVNSVKQIHAIVNDRAVVISESSVRNDLLFDDEDGITCLTNDEIFENLALMGKGVKFLGKVTLLFDSMLVPHQALEGEGSEQPTEPQPTPSPTHPSIGDQPPMTDSSSSHDTTQDSRDSLEDTNGSEGTQGRKNAKPEPTLDAFDDLDADGRIYIETEDVVKEGRQSNETEELNKGSGEKGGSTEELVSTAVPKAVSSTRPDTLIKMKKGKAKEKGVSFKDIEDSSRPARSILSLKPLPTIDPKDKGKSVLEEPEPAKKMTRSDFDAAQIAAIAETYDEVQAGIDADALFVAKLQQEEREEYTIEERANLLAETIAA